MPKAQSHYLIVGADSMVGGELITRLRQSGANVSGTTRRRERVSAEILHLDLSQDAHDWQPPNPIDVAILCAGITGIQACRDQPAASRRINVEGIAAIAKNLRQTGTFVIYLSTNQVFDGTIPFRSSTDSPCPVTEYGRQKAAAEQRLSAEGSVDAIVRLTKVLGPGNSLFKAWKQALLCGQNIQPFADMTFSPVPLGSVASVVLLIASQRLTGIFHVSGETDITYAEAARIAAQAMEADVNLVQPIKAIGTSPQTEVSPAYTSLSVDGLKTTIGLVPPSVQWTVETAFRNPEQLAGT